MIVVVRDVLIQRREPMPRMVDQHTVQRSRHSRRIARTHCCAYALAFGACGDVRSTAMPSAEKTVPKAAVYVLSLARVADLIARLFRQRYTLRGVSLLLHRISEHIWRDATQRHVFILNVTIGGA
jgi:hypothetical protein